MIHHNTSHRRFEMEFAGEFAYLDYYIENGVMNLAHTFVPPNHRHQGIAFELVKFALEYAKIEHLKIIDGCSSVTLYIEQHPEYEPLLATYD